MDEGTGRHTVTVSVLMASAKPASQAVSDINVDSNSSDSAHGTRTQRAVVSPAVSTISNQRTASSEPLTTMSPPASTMSAASPPQLTTLSPDIARRQDRHVRKKCTKAVDQEDRIVNRQPLGTHGQLSLNRLHSYAIGPKKIFALAFPSRVANYKANKISKKDVSDARGIAPKNENVRSVPPEGSSKSGRKEERAESDVSSSPHLSSSSSAHSIVVVPENRRRTCYSRQSYGARRRSVGFHFTIATRKLAEREEQSDDYEEIDQSVEKKEESKRGGSDSESAVPSSHRSDTKKDKKEKKKEKKEKKEKTEDEKTNEGGRREKSKRAAAAAAKVRITELSKPDNPKKIQQQPAAAAATAPKRAETKKVRFNVVASKLRRRKSVIKG